MKKVERTQIFYSLTTDKMCVYFLSYEDISDWQ